MFLDPGRLQEGGCLCSDHSPEGLCPSGAYTGCTKMLLTGLMNLLALVATLERGYYWKIVHAGLEHLGGYVVPRRKRFTFSFITLQRTFPTLPT